MIKHTNADFPICVKQWVEDWRNEEVGEVECSIMLEKRVSQYKDEERQ